jgi:hypothetical protein
MISPKKKQLDKLKELLALTPPREHGYDVVGIYKSYA